MSSAEPNLYEWYQHDGLPAELGGWVYDDSYLTTGALPPNTGSFPAPVGGGAYVAVTGHPADPSLAYAAPVQTPGGWQSDTTDNGYFPHTPVSSINKSWPPAAINLTAPALTPGVQDLSPWGAAPPPCEPNLPYPENRHVPNALHTPFEVAQPSLAPAPMLSGPPPFGSSAGSVMTPPYSASSDGTDQQQHHFHHHHYHDHYHQHHQHHPGNDEPHHNYLCAFKRAAALKEPQWQALKHERKRASRQQAEMRHRKKEREGQEQIKTTSKRLQDLHANLVAEERALMAEKITLMGELLTHAHCKDGAISEYLSYASKEIVKKAREQHLQSDRGRRSGSAPPGGRKNGVGI